MKKLNWGILAPGTIAAQFAEAANGVDTAKLHSVASRNPARAEAFAKKYSVEKVAQNYQDLIDDPDIDVIYIASPHNLHAEQSIACLRAGKAVLCEKPMTVNVEQAKSVFDAAKKNNTFYMEAVWTRFMPVYKKVHTWISNGLIGDVQMVHASFGFAMNYGPEHRMYNPALAGGALLDLGIYPITLAQMAIDCAPDEVSAQAEFGATGVDENLGMVLRYPAGQVATLSASARTNLSNEAWIFGSKGRIHIPMFWCATQASLYENSAATNEKSEHFQHPHAINGFEYEIEEVNRCLNEGLLESPTLPWQKSLIVMQAMDDVRSKIGLKYPFEKQP